MLLLCMTVLLVTGSNMTNAVLMLAFLLLFIFKTDRLQKSMIMVCFFMMVIFLAKVSPENNKYVAELAKKFTGDHSPEIQSPVASAQI